MAATGITKEGYLNEKYRYFHLKDTAGQEHDFHYHEFDKLVMMISGKVIYMIEDKSYALMPRDILLVGNHTIHKAIIDQSVPYERIIIYLDRNFYKNILKNVDLCQCFDIADRTGNYLFHPDRVLSNEISQLLVEHEKYMALNTAWDNLISDGQIVNLLAHINKMIALTEAKSQIEIEFDPRIKDTLHYISRHLSSNLTVDELADRVYLSRYHFMRLFKAQVGCSVSEHINQKRLLSAAHMIREGRHATEVAAELGFSDYSGFYRAFKKQFNISPKDLLKNQSQ